MKDIRVGVIGLNFASRVHIPSLIKTSGFKIVALCSKNTENAKKLKKKINLDCEIFNDPDKLIQSRETDLIDIVTPPKFHAALVEKSLENGKNILCEKPFGLSYEELKKLDLNRSEKAFINYLFRTEKLICILKKKIEDGQIGCLNKININWNFSSKNKALWKESKKNGGNIVDDVFSHVLDYLFFLTNKKNLEVEKFKYSRKKVSDILQEEIEGKVFFEDIEVDIKIKKNIESKNNHTIEIFGEIRDIIINYYAPFTPLDKNMRIEKNGIVEKIISEDSISPVCDDRIISFGNLLNEFKKTNPKNLCDLRFGAYTRFHLDRFIKYVY
tara:strand:+ start:7616 stop:8599 length:984 start_codon:yes stop_codon:yes gene_type:complete